MDFDKHKVSPHPHYHTFASKIAKNSPGGNRILTISMNLQILTPLGGGPITPQGRVRGGRVKSPKNLQKLPTIVQISWSHWKSIPYALIIVCKLMYATINNIKMQQYMTIFFFLKYSRFFFLM